MSTHNIGFYKDLKKIIFQLSSNTHQVISSDFTFIIHSSYSKRNLRHQNETIKDSITSTLFPKYSILIEYAYVKQNYHVDRRKTVLCDFQHSCLLLCAV